MNELKEAKEIYDRIEIPTELDQRVSDLTNSHMKKVSDIPMKNKRKYAGPMVRHTMAAAAAVVVCFTIALNSSEVFAQAAGKLPVLGGIAKVLTIRSYQASENNMNISVNVPEIVSGTSQNAENPAKTDITKGMTDPADNTETAPAGETNQFVADINAEIDGIVNEYLTDAKSRMQADKDAFIATGGTEEDWAKRDLNIKVDYEVKSQQGDRLSLILTTDESWYGAYDVKYFYNLDLKENRKLTLKDILGETYTEIANTGIIKQMKERAAEDSNVVYWGITDNDKSGIDGFVTVDENTKFYLNKDGKPVVCFDKYEIAPGFMGSQEFVIN
jgi:hypothetical protein